MGVGALGLATGVALDRTVQATTSTPAVERALSPWGAHQSGIVTPAPASTQLISLDFKPDVDADALRRLLRVWSQDIVNLTKGQPVTGDPAPMLAQANEQLSVTVGLGHKAFTLGGLAAKKPVGFIDIPAMRHDRLQAQWNGGHLCALVSAQNPTTVDYVVESLLRDASGFATLRWLQTASWRGTDATGARVTGRNHFGQVDGSGNPRGDDVARTVFSQDGWFTGGTQLVVRRIEMDLPLWNTLTANEQEQSLGRDFAHGAPLSGGAEFDVPDFEAKGSDGRFKISPTSHVALSHPAHNQGRTMFRRGMNYTHIETVDGRQRRSSGLVFMAFQANIAEQFVPVQRRLDEADDLNTWTHAVGSATFAILPGFTEGGFLGEGLFT